MRKGRYRVRYEKFGSGIAYKLRIPDPGDERMRISDSELDPKNWFHVMIKKCTVPYLFQTRAAWRHVEDRLSHVRGPELDGLHTKMFQGKGRRFPGFRSHGCGSGYR